MNTNKSTTGIDPKVKLSFRKIAVITGVIFIIATVCPSWPRRSYLTSLVRTTSLSSLHIRTRWPQECCSFSSGTLHVPA